MLNLKGLIKSLIVSNLSFLIEDFTENDINIDRWNGRIQKENVKIKKDSVEKLTQKIIGVPFTVVQGYIKKLQIDIPWRELQSKPLEVTIEDLHVILTASECYERKFVKNTLIALKKLKVEQLLKIIEEQLKSDLQPKEGDESSVVNSGFLSRLSSVILENLRINVRNIHIRFEDNYVSRRNQAFNFGIISESITYSMTNNRFVRAFLNIDDKLQEQRSFSMLKILKLAIYWNSNAQDNWTKSREFIHLAAQGIITFSKNHMEILMSKHNASKQDYNYSNVFLMQPTDVSVKFRTNLAPLLQWQIPIDTIAFEVSDVTLSLDEEVLKDIQYLTKFFAWHANSNSKKGYLKLRPAYNIPIKGNAKAYWRYAIKSTIYLLRKDKQDKGKLQKKRQQETLELTEIYRLEKINDYYKSIGQSERLLKVEEKVVSIARFSSFKNEQMLANRRKHLEYKLTPEQMVVAIKKAEKASKVYIDDYQQRTGWRAWVPTKLKSYWFGGMSSDAPEIEDQNTVEQEGAAAQQSASSEDAQFYEQLNSILDKTSKLMGEQDETSATNEDYLNSKTIDDPEEEIGATGVEGEQNRRQKPIKFHLSVIAPLIELLIVNKQHGTYNAKCFMSTAIQDVFYQQVYYKDGNSQQLFSLRSFDVVDKLVQSPRFQRTIYKGPIRQVPEEKIPDLSQRVMQRFNQQNVGLNMANKYNSSLHEVEEESNPNVNNGLPRVRYFQDINRNINEADKYFFIFQMTATQVKKLSNQAQEENKSISIQKYKIDTMLNHTVLFYNRTLISRAQTFFHQATVSKAQNASADADFDSKIAAMQKATGQSVNTLLECSEFEIACAMKGVEFLVPDDINFEESKFLLLQTGNIMARSRKPIGGSTQPQRDLMNGFDLGPPQPTISQSNFDPLFLNAIKDKIQNSSETSGEQFTPDFQDVEINSMNINKKQMTKDKTYSDQQMSILQVLHQNRSQQQQNASTAAPISVQEDYALTIFDIQILYLKSFNHLEAIEYNEIVKEETEKRYSLLKRTDIQLDFSKVQIQNSSDSGKENIQDVGATIDTENQNQKIQRETSLIKVGFSIANIDLKLTTKEVKDIKFFADRFLKYHKDLDDQVREELIKINLEEQFRQSINRDQSQQDESLNMQAHQARINQQLQGNGNAVFDTVKSVLPNQQMVASPSSSKSNFIISTISSHENLFTAEDNDSDDEFFDAVDTFDQQIIDIMNAKKLEDTKEQEILEKTPRAQSFFYDAIIEESYEEDQSIIEKDKKKGKKKAFQFAQNIAFCASASIGKFRIQILEATNIQEELVRNLKERLSGGYNSESIELQLQQKGLPFLNFELSKLCLTYLSAPSMVPLSSKPKKLTDLHLSTLSVKDFCLMNQEKVTQPQILLRSSNYEVAQAYHHASGKRDRGVSNSFSHSSLPKDKSSKPQQLYFDLEEEDNMAMADQAVEEIDEYFVRLTVSSSILNKFETKSILTDISVKNDDKENNEGEQNQEKQLEKDDGIQEVDEEEEPPEQVTNKGVIDVHNKVSEDNKVVLDGNLGQAEGEITEHSIRKIMECLIQDFPQTTNFNDDASRFGQSQKQESNLDESLFINLDKTVNEEDQDENECQVQKFRSIKANLHSDGFIYKMRLRKEETVVKLIDFTFSILRNKQATDLPSSLFFQELNFELSDFQVLHQGNELIFKHSFGQDLLMDLDKSMNLANNFKIWSLKITEQEDSQKIQTKLNNFLFIFESKACLQILQNISQLKNIVVKSAPRLFHQASRSNLVQQNVNVTVPESKSLEVFVAINDCYLQLPVQDSKNSLFLELSSLTYEQNRSKDQEHKLNLNAAFHALNIYVAKQINQINKYYLVQLHESALQAQISKRQGGQQLDCQLGLVKLTMNENYLLFIASLIEYHFNDVKALIKFSKQLAPKSTTEADVLQTEKQMSSEDGGFGTLDSVVLNEMSKSSPFLKSIIASESVKSQFKKALVRDYIKISIDSVSFEWVFGLGFDDHEENFVTLSNRNFSKIILDQFDRNRSQKVKPIDIHEDAYSDYQENSELLIDTGKQPGLKKSHSKAQQLGSVKNPLLDKIKKQSYQQQSYQEDQSQQGEKSNYEKLTICFKKIQVEKASTASENQYTNMTCSQIVIDQTSPELEQAYPILLIRQKSVPNAVSITSTQSSLKAYLSFFDLRVCQRSVTVISSLVKDVYSCKNVIQRGKKRRFFRAFYEKKSKKQNLPSQNDLLQNSSSFEVSFDVRKIRVVFYDSIESESKKANQSNNNKDSTPASQFIRGLQSQAIEDFGNDPDQIDFKPGSLLSLETGLRISNLKPLKQQDEDDMVDNDSISNDSQEGGYQPDRQLNLRVSNFSIFTNTKRTTLLEIPQQDQRLMILYPTDVIFGQQFYSQKNLQMIDIQVSLIEFEMSFKQAFMLQLLFKKILDACQPVTQIFEQQKTKARSSGGLKASAEGGENLDEQNQPKNGILLSMHVNSIYFALIKENQGQLSGRHMAYISNDSSSMPMLSLEIKWFELRQKSQITGLQQTNITFPLELYYFNQKLNFFEPVIERVLIKTQTDTDVGGNTEKLLNVDDVLNLNFSVALYENIFVLLENLNHESDVYKKIIEQTERENLIESLKNITSPKATALQQSQYASRDAQALSSNSINFIKNKTGELLLFKAGRQPAFTEMQANETLPLDFQRNNPVGIPSNTNLLSAEDTGSKGLFDGVASSEMQPDSDMASNNWVASSSDEDSAEPDADDISNFMTYNAPGYSDLRSQMVGEIGQKPRSMYRRGKFKFKKSEPNRVICQVLIQHGKILERTPSFEINFDSLSCQRVYLDENRQLYVICQIQNKDGQKILIVRSPMQVTNNLQIPVEVQLNNQIQENPKKKAARQAAKENGLIQEESKDQRRKTLLNIQENFDFSMIIKPEQSMIIPLQACNFKSVQIRPLIHSVGKTASSMYKQESKFEWSQKANICLLQDEREIFEQKPIILCSKMIRNNFVVDRNNNQVFFNLNSNTYSIRSYIDFNTQQTDFISLRYLSITAPFTIQNLIPVPITMLFKNIERQDENSRKEKPQLNSYHNSKDRQMYDLELKHNSSLQVLYLNPLGNFDFSLAIPGFEHSNFVKFKLEREEDFELSNDLTQSNYLEAVGLGLESSRSKKRPASSKSSKTNKHDGDQDDAKPDGDYSSLHQKAQFRFIKQKKLLLQLCSQFQSQFNICADIAFVQGFYHISFYAKYWFLNNTQMPLQARISQKTFSYPTLDMPYHSQDFDFDTAKQFLDRDYGQNAKGLKQDMDEEQHKTNLLMPPKRRDSGETYLTETVTMREQDPRQDESCSEGMATGTNFMKLKNKMQAIDANGEPFSKGSMLRVKPWETYRYTESKSKGLLAALNQEDIDRVSTIYFTQEMIKEEEKEQTEYGTARDRTNSNVYQTVNSQTINESNQDAYLSARSNNLQSNQTDQFHSVNSGTIAPSQEKKPIKNVQFQIDITNEDNSQTQSNSKKEKGIMQRSKTQLGFNDFNNVERLTKFSKTSIQITNFQQQLNEQQTVPLNHTQLAEFELFEAPLEDKDQLKRVILFSDVPTDVQNSENYSNPAQSIDGNKISSTESQSLLLRICDSEWSTLPFDLTTLQQEPIQIKDIERKDGQPQALFELVSVVTFLPQPFSFSKLVCFQPRYLMVNRTFHTLYVVQSQCEELGKFKIFPQETSVFHWTDASKPLEVCVTLEEHEYSGNLRIDGIGEFNLRLKSIQEQDSTILNVSISEENNSFFIVFTDVSYAPPYRLENLTKTRFKVAQVKSRQDDFDHLNPYQPLSFAWSYPLQPKLLKISLCQLDFQEELGSFSIDSISKSKRITMKDRSRSREYILEITNEKTMKVVRILNPQQTLYEDELEQNMLLNDDTSQREAKQSKIKIKINRLGLSVVNSQAREICYTSIFNLRFAQESTDKHQKVGFKAQDVQIDNQLCRQPDAIIFKREQSLLGNGEFFRLKYLFVKNQAIENLLHYKYFILKIVPFELNLDGNFCDETYKYVMDVFQMTQKFTSRAQFANDIQKNLLNDGTDPTQIKQPNFISSVGDKVDQFKSAYTELNKKGQPYMDTQRDVKKIYIEQFQISEIRLSFTFSSSPILFREFTMNPTLKFFLVLLSNMKNVKLRFSKYQTQNQHVLMSIFLAQLKRFYVQECCNHQQLFKIVTSMGLFGSISTTITGISTALKSLIQRPFITYHEENTLKAILLGSVVFVKDSLYVVSGSVGSVYNTFINGFSILLTYGQQNQEVVDMVVDKDLFDDDIEQAQRGITSFSTPLTAVDTQNRIWLKILMREKQNYEDKKRIILRKQHKTLDQSEVPQQADQQMRESLFTANSSVQPTRQYMIDSKKAQQDPNLVYKLAYFTTQSVLFLPRKILQTGTIMINSLIPDEISRSRANMPSKVRPPRFVSFTMELEPYSKKKAFALEILNDINLNVFETETINKLYTMNAHVVIVTGKRIICVDELRSSEQSNGVSGGTVQEGQGTISSSSKEKIATHQKIKNGLDKLIIARRNPNASAAASSISQNLLNDNSENQDKEINKNNNQEVNGENNVGVQTKKRESFLLRQPIHSDDAQGEKSQATNGFGSGMQMDSSAQYKHWNVFFKDIFKVSIDIVDRETNKVISWQDLDQICGQNGPSNSAKMNIDATKIYFVLKIHYQKNGQDENEDDGTITGVFTSNRKDKSGNREDNDGLMGGLSGLKVGRKEIVTKDWKVMRRVYTAIQNYSRRSTLL